MNQKPLKICVSDTVKTLDCVVMATAPIFRFTKIQQIAEIGLFVPSDSFIATAHLRQNGPNFKIKDAHSLV